MKNRSNEIEKGTFFDLMVPLTKLKYGGYRNISCWKVIGVKELKNVHIQISRIEKSKDLKIRLIYINQQTGIIDLRKEISLNKSIGNPHLKSIQLNVIRKAERDHMGRYLIGLNEVKIMKDHKNQFTMTGLKDLLYQNEVVVKKIDI